MQIKTILSYHVHTHQMGSRENSARDGQGCRAGWLTRLEECKSEAPSRTPRACPVHLQRRPVHGPSVPVLETSFRETLLHVCIGIVGKSSRQYCFEIAEKELKCPPIWEWISKSWYIPRSLCASENNEMHILICKNLIKIITE